MVTQADIDNLNAAIATGVRSTTVGGQTVTYGTIDALIKARDDLQGQLNAQVPRAVQPRLYYPVYGGRGYN